MTDLSVEYFQGRIKFWKEKYDARGVDITRLYEELDQKNQQIKSLQAELNPIELY